jgi:hypothetical protein
MKGVGDILAGQKGSRPTLVGTQLALMTKTSKAVWGFFLTTLPENAKVQNTPHHSWKRVSMKLKRNSTRFPLRREERAAQSRRTINTPNPRSARQAEMVASSSAGAGAYRPQKVEAADAPGPQNLQKASLLDVAQTSRSRRSRKVAKRRPSTWSRSDAGKIRERAVNKISRRGKRLRRLTGRGTKPNGGKTEIEDLTRKLAESEDLHFNGKTKIEDSRVKVGGGSERKTFGGCHGAGTSTHCTGASTTGVWVTVARGVLE